MKKLYVFTLSLIFTLNLAAQEKGTPREWVEVLLEGIRNDFARPTVHSRNLYHMSMAMYDAWAIYDTTNTAEGLLLGKTLHGMDCPIGDFPQPTDYEAAREEAVSYAAYRFLAQRFADSPAEIIVQNLSNALMAEKGYSLGITAITYQSGIPGTMGNYIARCVLDYGLTDNSNEVNDYENQFYQPVNSSLLLDSAGTSGLMDFNRWQPLTFDVFVDQSGNEFPGKTPDFLSPEWGSVFPFSLSEADLDTFQRDGNDYFVYHDPGAPPYIDTSQTGGLSEEYKWGFGLVAKWSSHVDPADTTFWDISPASIGNIQSYPTSIEEYRDFYDDQNGGDTSIGRDVNPATGAPYEPQMVRRGDYARVLAEFWADGPDSETPPGHWFTILNYVMDQPDFVRSYNGKTDTLSPLEYEIKAYLTLAGTLHDVAVTVWGMKGWYDYIRPISAIRGIAELGQSSDASLMSYHPGGILLDTGFIELVLPGDALAGMNAEHVGKIKAKAWRGPDFITDPSMDIAGVDWILAENWWPYQRPTFVTPNFSGFVSGHSTFSRAAAEVMTMLTGDEYFPGGMGVFEAPQNNFLVFEQGPSSDIQLQWATYRDASDQCSLSRIWGGIHPPADDIPGRLMGIEIGTDAFSFARELFYNDVDGDGFYNYEDCDDENPDIYPGAVEVCDGIDNNCDGNIDELLQLFTYYLDADQDDFGDENFPLDTCLLMAPMGYVDNALDCNDQDSLFHPNVLEICDGLDNDCSGVADDNQELFAYYLDVDEDGFGDPATQLDTCLVTAPMGYVSDSTDCDDTNMLINTSATDIANNGIDEDCDGEDFISGVHQVGADRLVIAPNPVKEYLQIRLEGKSQNISYQLFDYLGAKILSGTITNGDISVSSLASGVYYLELIIGENQRIVERIVKL